MVRQVRRLLHDQRPFGERQSEAGEGAVTGSNRVKEAGEHQESDPVEEECHDKCRNEHKVRSQQTVVHTGSGYATNPRIPRDVVVMVTSALRIACLDRNKGRLAVRVSQSGY